MYGNLYWRGRHRFVYMQGGAYVLSRRAALSMAPCPRGGWARCPGRYLYDIKNRTSALSTVSECFHEQLSFNEDVYVGACMAEAARAFHRDNFVIASHPCFWSFPPAVGRASTPFWWGLREKCSCPLTAHSLKDGYPGQGRLLGSKRSLQLLCMPKRKGSVLERSTLEREALEALNSNHSTSITPRDVRVHAAPRDHSSEENSAAPTSKLNTALTSTSKLHAAGLVYWLGAPRPSKS